MKAPKVRLYVRIRHGDGKDAFVDPVWNRNRTLRAGYALVNGKQEQHKEGVYYLRFKPKGSNSRRWVSVGEDPELAIVALRNVEHELQAVELGRSVTASPEQPETYPFIEPPLSLKKAIDSYLDGIRKRRGKKTISASTNMLGRFLASFPKKLLKDITRDDLLAHAVSLEDEGLGKRSVYNHIARIETFLKANGIVGLLEHGDRPDYDEKEVSAYNDEELKALFAAATPEEKLLFSFFLATGFREQEVQFCTWANVDFRGKLISVKSKPELGFRLKDKEERSVPVPDALIAALLDLKRRSSSVLLFPNAQGNPDGHMLRKLRRLALRAGLNCGECRTVSGGKTLSCKTHAVCSHWGLHKCRKTFATLHSEAGVSVRNIQDWLGHASLETTLAYLAVADKRSERTRLQVNASFAALTKESAA